MTDYIPLYINGKRGKARRYVHPSWTAIYNLAMDSGAIESYIAPMQHPQGGEDTPQTRGDKENDTTHI